MESQAPSPNSQKKGFPFFSDAVIAVIIPIAGYYVAFSYETGYAGHFGISASLVDVGLPEVLRVIGLLIVLYLLILGYLDYRMKLYKGKSPISRAVGRALFPVLVTFALIVILNFTGVLRYVTVLFLFLYPFTEFVIPLITQRKTKDYKNKLIAQEQEDAKRKSSQTLLEVYYARGEGTLKIAALILLAICLFGMNYLGNFVARNETSFLVLKSNPELVVLLKCSNKLICSEFDREKKEIRKAFYVKSIDQIAEEGTKVTTEFVGPLKVSIKK